MKLKSLTIEEIESWQDTDAGKYRGRVSYEGERGSTTLTLDPAVSLALLQIIGPIITKFSHQVALQLEESINQAVIESQKVPTIQIEG